MGIGNLLGIPLRVNASWIIIFATVTYFLIVGQFPAQFPSWHPITNVATRIAVVIGRLVSWSFIALGFVIVYNHDVFNGIWLAFIGWFLGQAVGAAARQARIREALEGYTARDLMTGDLPSVSPRTTL